MFIEPPVPPPPGFAGPGLDVPDEDEPTVTGPRWAPAAYAPMKITASRSRKPHSFAAGLTGTSPPSLLHTGDRRCVIAAAADHPARGYAATLRERGQITRNAGRP